jgi:hypothetical protein
MKNLIQAAVVTLFAATATQAQQVVVFDDFTPGPVSVSVQAIDSVESSVSGESPNIAPFAGLDRRRWIDASHSRWSSGWTGPGTDPAYGSASVAVGASSADFHVGIWGGDDLMYQAASAALSYRALPGQSFDLGGFEFLDLVGSGSGGQSGAVNGLTVTIADASGTMTYIAQGGWNGAVGSFRVPLWHGSGFIWSDPNGGRIVGAVDLSAVTSVSIGLSGQQNYGQPLYGGSYVNYSLSSVQLVVPGPGGVVVLALLTACRRKLGFSRRTC